MPGNSDPYAPTPPAGNPPEGAAPEGAPPATAPGLSAEILQNEGSGYCTQVRLSWGAGEGVSHLELWRTDPNGYSYQMGWYYPSAGSQYDYGFSLTREDQDWTYELRAYDWDGVLIGSNTATVTLVDEKPAITDAPGATYNGLGQGCARVKILVARLDDCDIVKYRVERKDSETGEFQTFTEIYPQYYPPDPENPDAPFEIEDGVNPEPSPGRKYWYRVIPVDYLGDGDASPVAEVTLVDTPPAAPTGLAIEEENHGISCTQLTLSWSFTPPEEECDIDHFKVWRNEVTEGTPGEWEEVTTVAVNGGYYPGEGGGGDGYNYSVTVSANPAPDPGITYQFRVDSVDRAGQVTEGETSSLTLIDEIPADVSDVSGAVTNEGKNCSRVELSWTAPESPDNCDIVSYEIRRSFDGGAEEVLTQVGSGTTSYTDYSIEPTPEGRTYTYTVVSIDRSGQESTGATFTTESLTDDLPEEFSASADDQQGGIGCASVTIEISDTPECDFDHYEIYRSDENGEVLLTTLTSSWGGPPSYTDYSVEPLPDAGRTYTYRIVKVDRAGQETPFTVAVTLIDVPPTPYDFHLLGDPNHSQVFLGWTPTFECDIQKIELYGSTDENAALTSDNKLLEQYDQGWTQVTHYNLIPNTTYYYTLVVYDRAGQTATSTLSATTEASNTSLALKVFKNEKKQVPNPYYPDYGDEFTEEDGPDWAAEIANEGVAGGKLWVVLQSDIGSLERFSSASDTGYNRLRVTEMPDAAHGVAHSLPTDEEGNAVPNADGLNPNLDLGIDQYTQWYRQGGGDGWEKATVNEQGEGATPTNPGSGGGQFRMAFPWQSTTQPLGHNGMHSIALQKDMRFGGQGYENYGDEYPIPAPDPKKVDVQNLVVSNVSTSNGNQDYFKWDPLSDEVAMKTPSLSFTIKDLGDPHKYKWTVWFAETKWIHALNVPDWTSDAFKITGNVSSAGVVTIALADIDLVGHLDEAIHERGPYTYDIRVIEYEGNTPPGDDEIGAIDKAQFKQPYMEWIPNSFTLPGETQSHPGHAVWYEEPEDSEDLHLKANYYLFPNPATNNLGLANIQLTPMDPIFMERPPLTPNMTKPGILYGGEEGLQVYNITPDDPDGDWRVIFTGDDASGPPIRRSHECQRMIAVNDKEDIISILPYATTAGGSIITDEQALKTAVDAMENTNPHWYGIFINCARAVKKVSQNNPGNTVKSRVDSLSTASNLPKDIGRRWVAVNAAYTAHEGLGIAIGGVAKGNSWGYGWPIANDLECYPNISNWNSGATSIRLDPHPDTEPHYQRYFRRWAFGMHESWNRPTHDAPKNYDFVVGLDNWRTFAGQEGYWFPNQPPATGYGHAVADYPYGLDGLQSLIVAGQPMAMMLPENAVGGSENDGKVAARDMDNGDMIPGLTKTYLHLPFQDWTGQTLYKTAGYHYPAIGVSENGKHMYIVRGWSKTPVDMRDLFHVWATAHQEGTQTLDEVYKNAQKEAVKATWPKWVADELPTVLPTGQPQWPFTPGKAVTIARQILINRKVVNQNSFPDNVHNAVLFDGGSDAQLKYRRRISKGNGPNSFSEIKDDSDDHIATQVEVSSK